MVAVSEKGRRVAGSVGREVRADTNRNRGVLKLSATRRMAWRPRERLTVTEWADRYRTLPESSATPGPWTTDLTPYLAEVMDAFGDPTVETIVFVKSAQVGGTEALNNMLAYAIDQDPGPALYVYPVEKDAREEVRSRIVPMIIGSPRLGDHIPFEGWDNATELKLDTMRINMAWAAAPGTLIRRAIRYAFLDEPDNCDAQAGRLGNTTALVRKRLTTYRGSCKLAMGSTPTTEHGACHQEWIKSDMRRYHVPCPKCGTYQVLNWRQIKVDKQDRDPKKIAALDLAWYECLNCKAKLKDNDHKRWMIDRGVWICHTQTIVEKLPVKKTRVANRAVRNHKNRWWPEIEGHPPIGNTAGFHINALYSPWREWSDILAEWFECKGNPEAQRVFYNATLGEPWKEAIDEVKPSVLQDKSKRGLPRDLVPAEAMVLIVGADVQKDCIYYTVRAWGPGRRSWLIRHGVVLTLEELYEAIAMHRFPIEGSDETMAPLYVAIDSGHRTEEVYRFAKTHSGVLCCKGQQKADYAVKPATVKYTLKNGVEVIDVTLYHVNTSMFKEMLYRMIHTKEEDPGAFFVSVDTDDDYCNQITAEHQVWRVVTVGRTKRKIPVWELKHTHAPNHYLDTEVYGLAIAHLKGALSLSKPKAPPPTTTERSEDNQRFGTGPRGLVRRKLGRAT